MTERRFAAGNLWGGRLCSRWRTRVGGLSSERSGREDECSVIENGSAENAPQATRATRPQSRGPLERLGP